MQLVKQKFKINFIFVVKNKDYCLSIFAGHKIVFYKL